MSDKIQSINHNVIRMRSELRAQKRVRRKASMRKVVLNVDERTKGISQR